MLQTEEIGFFSTLSINLLYIVASLGNYLVIVTLLKDLNAVELFYSHIQQVIWVIVQLYIIFSRLAMTQGKSLTLWTEYKILGSGTSPTTCTIKYIMYKSNGVNVEKKLMNYCRYINHLPLRYQSLIYHSNRMCHVNLLGRL